MSPIIYRGADICDGYIWFGTDGTIVCSVAEAITLFGDRLWSWSGPEDYAFCDGMSDAAKGESLDAFTAPCDTAEERESYRQHHAAGYCYAVSMMGKEPKA